MSEKEFKELDDAIGRLETLTGNLKHTREGRVLEILENIEIYVDAKIAGGDLSEGLKALKAAIDDLLWM